MASTTTAPTKDTLTVPAVMSPNRSSTISPSAPPPPSSSSPSSAMRSQPGLAKMDPELRCPTCSRYFLSPILLPCGHSLCASCAVNALRPISDATVSAALQAIISASEASSAAPQKRPSTVAVTPAANTTTFEAIIHNEPNLEGSSSTVSGASHGGTDSDQQSIVSEADSGVVMASRGGIYAGRLPAIICPNLLGFVHITHPSNLSQQVVHSLTNGLACPLCHRIVALMDEKAINHLPRNRALERVLAKLVGEEAVTSAIHPDTPARQGVPICQLCDEPDPLNMDPLSIGGARIGEGGSCRGGTAATVWCEQCSIFYCEECRERCHPKRGPLLKHALHPAATGAEIIRQKRQNQPPLCPAHPHEPASLYCIACCVAICSDCVLPADNLHTACIRTPNSYGQHAHSEVQSLHTYCKHKKTELSQVLQALSEKARAGTQHIQQLRSISETVMKSAKRAEEDATVKFDCLIQTIEAKKAELVSAIKEERDRKLSALKEQIHQCTSKLTRSTGLIQFCIEMLKENDAFAFLLVSQSLINRVLHTEQSFLHAIETPPAVVQYCPRAQPTSTTSGQSHPSTPAHWVKGRSAPLAHSSFVSLMQLDAIHKVISDLSLHEGIDDQLIDCSASSASSDCEVPNAPVFRAEECLSEGNIITLVWQPCPGFGIDYYTLEIDDGAGGAFRKVYRGIETMCTIEGLHFKSMYRARVKAHNQSGYSAYSDRLVIQTSTHSWFHMDPTRSSAGGLQFSNSNRSLTCQSMEDCVALASTGLSRGIHYWEFVIDRLDAGGQPSFGIAKSDCNKEAMLGHDSRAWAMYIDQKRSWFLHNGEHFERTDGGISVGSVIGVRLDCERGSLAYYLDDEPHGPIAFTGLSTGVYYPAISLNRDVQVTLRSGLEPPSSDSEDSDENTSPCPPLPSVSVTAPALALTRPLSGKSNQSAPSQ